MTSKQRAFLRAAANKLEPIAQVGKAGVTPEQTASLDEVLEARELIKISVLESCEDRPKDAADTISGRTKSEIVQVVGRKIVLYRRSVKKPVVELPKG